MGKNKTIYFRSHILEKLKTVESAGGLINDLLEAHFHLNPGTESDNSIDTRQRGRNLEIHNGEVVSSVGDMDTIVGERSASNDEADHSN